MSGDCRFGKGHFYGADGHSKPMVVCNEHTLANLRFKGVGGMNADEPNRYVWPLEQTRPDSVT